VSRIGVLAVKSIGCLELDTLSTFEDLEDLTSFAFLLGFVFDTLEFDFESVLPVAALYLSSSLLIRLLPAVLVRFSERDFSLRFPRSFEWSLSLDDLDHTRSCS
jgi:hypothetical protein